VPPRRVRLPWGLSPGDVWSWLPQCRHLVEVTERHRIRGLHRRGGSRILTFRYQDDGGAERVRTIFVKLTAAGREAQKHRYLADRGAPVTPLIGTVTTAAGEIIALEFLPRIGTTPDEADALLQLVAALNSIDLAVTDLFDPPPGDPEYVHRIHGVLRALNRSAQHPFDPDHWLAAYREAADRAARMPVALNHNELSFQQVGWTPAPTGPRLVAFDLETMALLPRYTDVAGILAPLSAQTGRSEQHLFDSYLRALADHTGDQVDRAASWHSMLVLRIVRTVEALPWLITMPATPYVETAEQAVARLQRDLQQCALVS
jgi:hypothetical protein